MQEKLGSSGHSGLRAAPDDRDRLSLGIVSGRQHCINCLRNGHFLLPLVRTLSVLQIADCSRFYTVGVRVAGDSRSVRRSHGKQR